MNTFWIVIFSIGQNIPQTQIFFNNPNNIISEFNLIRWLQAYGINTQYPFLYPLWFLKNLFILNILAIIIKKIIDTIPRLSFIILMGLYLFLPSTGIYYINIIDLFMWCLGYYIVKFKWNLNFFDNKRYIKVIFIVCLLIRTLLKDSEIPIISIMIYRMNLLVNLIFWYSVFTKNINGNIQKIFFNYSRFSFGIYIFHEMALSFSKKVIARLFGNSFNIMLTQYIVLPIIIIIFSVSLCIFMNKYTPKVYALVTGSRLNKKNFVE